MHVARAITTLLEAEAPPFRLVLGRRVIKCLVAEMDAKRRGIDSREAVANGADLP